MLLLVNKDNFLEDAKEVRMNLRFGLTDMQMLDMFPGNVSHLGVMTRSVKDPDIYAFYIDEVERENPDYHKHPVSTIRVFCPRINAKDLELVKLALKFDFNLEEDEYRIISV